MSIPLITKSYTIDDMDVDSPERTFTAKITTEIVDRDGEVVKAAGGDLAAYLANPTILYGHDYTERLPIGKSLAIGLDSDGRSIIAKGWLSTTEFADDVLTLLKEGVLRTTSIGFQPHASGSGAPSTKELSASPHWKGARNVIRSWTLYEYSVVPMPSNPGAVITAVAKGRIARATAKSLGVDLSPPPAAPIRHVTATEFERATRACVQRGLAQLDVAGLIERSVTAAIDRYRGRV